VLRFVTCRWRVLGYAARGRRTYVYLALGVMFRAMLDMHSAEQAGSEGRRVRARRARCCRSTRSTRRGAAAASRCLPGCSRGALLQIVRQSCRSTLRYTCAVTLVLL